MVAKHLDFTLVHMTQPFGIVGSYQRRQRVSAFGGMDNIRPRLNAVREKSALNNADKLGIYRSVGLVAAMFGKYYMSNAITGDYTSSFITSCRNQELRSTVCLDDFFPFAGKFRETFSYPVTSSQATEKTAYVQKMKDITFVICCFLPQKEQTTMQE